jgi:glycosyltransferase involved in cell wall biosynthesis
MYRLLYFFWRRPVHILHVNSYVPGNYARLAAILMGVPVIIDHWRGLLRFNAKRRLICQLLGRFTDLSLAISRSVRDHVLSECHLDPSRFRVAYVGVNLAKFQQVRPAAELRRELGLPPGVPLVGLVARMDNWAKGHLEFFAALNLLRPTHQVHALIIGSGRREAEIRALAQQEGLSKIVHFLGNRADVPSLLNVLDLFVNPSYTEGLSRALLEAMAAGRPVIASRVGGMAEVVRDGENGLLIPPRDPEALAQALARLLSAPTFAKKLGERARQDVQANYSLERQIKELNEIYGELVEKKFGGQR